MGTGSFGALRYGRKRGKGTVRGAGEKREGSGHLRKNFLKSMEKNLLKLEKVCNWGYITTFTMQKNPFTLH